MHFGKATNLRFAFQEQLDTLFESVDLIATPTSPTKAFPLVDHPANLREVVESRTSSMAMNTYPTNTTQHPSLSIPCGVGKHNLPIGLKLVGRPFDGFTGFPAASR